MSRALTPQEEKRFVRHVRKLNARDRALATAQLFLGFRISEVLALTIGHVLHNGRIRSHVTLPPRFLKGGYGNTRTVPVGPELQRALEAYLRERARHEELQPGAPLFLSRQHDSGGPQALCRSSAEKIIKAALVAVVGDPQGLSTHSLRKAFAQRLYRASKFDLLAVRSGLGHSSVAITQVYLRPDRQDLDTMILAGDWTRKSRKASQTIGSSVPRDAVPAEAPAIGDAEVVVPDTNVSDGVGESAPVINAAAAEPKVPSEFLPGMADFAA